MTSDLIDLLACPACGGALVLREDSDGLECEACGARYPAESGVPILLAPAPDDAGAPGSSHKATQIAFFDADPADDFGVTRPRGAPALHGWLLGEKFRRSVLGLEDLLPGSTALTVCGGSGLDAEFLARAGARVVLTDISLGVVRQAAERARRFGLDFDLVVADAENLPFRDGSVDVTYVHDGLHHLERPALALAEMARISRRAVSVSEPASAFATLGACVCAPDPSTLTRLLLRLKDVVVSAEILEEAWKVAGRWITARAEPRSRGRARSIGERGRSKRSGSDRSSSGTLRTAARLRSSSRARA